jgi:hypothetical protein
MSRRWFETLVLPEIEKRYHDAHMCIWTLPDDKFEHIKNGHIDIWYGPDIYESYPIKTPITTVTSSYSFHLKRREYSYGGGWSPGYECEYLSSCNVWR